MVAEAYVLWSRRRHQTGQMLLNYCWEGIDNDLHFHVHGWPAATPSSAVCSSRVSRVFKFQPVICVCSWKVISGYV